MATVRKTPGKPSRFQPREFKPGAFFRETRPVAQREGARRGAHQVPEAVPGYRLDAYVEKLTSRQRLKLDTLIRSAAARDGFAELRHGGRTWETYRRRVLEDFVRNEVDIDEIELPRRDVKSGFYQ